MLSYFPLGVVDGVWDLIESVLEGFPACSWIYGQSYYFGTV